MCIGGDLRDTFSQEIHKSVRGSYFFSSQFFALYIFMYEVFLYSFIVFKSLISDFLLFTLGFVYLQGFSLSQSLQRLVYLINFIGETLAMLK